MFCHPKYDFYFLNGTKSYLNRIMLAMLIVWILFLMKVLEIWEADVTI